MCLYRSSLPLPVCSLKATAYKICFHNDPFSFLHNQNSISDGLKGAEEKAAARGVVMCSWLRAACFQLGGAERVVLHHMILPVWQVSVV